MCLSFSFRWFFSFKCWNSFGVWFLCSGNGGRHHSCAGAAQEDHHPALPDSRGRDRSAPGRGNSQGPAPTTHCHQLLVKVRERVYKLCSWRFRLKRAVETRETREGWPLLTVQTELNGDSKRTYKRGPFLVGSLGLSCRCKRFLLCLGCSSRPSRYKTFVSSMYTFSIPLSLPPSKLGRQPCWVGCLCWRPREGRST
jgi:hypothetical protein